MFPILARVIIGVVIGGAFHLILTKVLLKKKVKDKVKNAKVNDALKFRIREKVKKGETTKFSELDDYDKDKEAVVVDVLNQENETLKEFAIFTDKIGDDIHIGETILLD